MGLTGCAPAADREGIVVQDNFEYKAKSFNAMSALGPLQPPEGMIYVVLCYKLRSADGQSALSPGEPVRIKYGSMGPYEADTHASSKLFLTSIPASKGITGDTYEDRKTLAAGEWADFTAVYLMPQQAEAHTGEMVLVP